MDQGFSMAGDQEGGRDQPARRRGALPILHRPRIIRQRHAGLERERDGKPINQTNDINIRTNHGQTR